MSTSTSEEKSTEQQANESKIDDNSITNPKEQIPPKYTKTRSKSDVAAKILQQTWKYPHKQVAALLDDENVTVQRIMDATKCKIYLNSTNYSQHKMVEITLEGTSDEIFNGHKEINYIRQNGHLMEDNDRKPNRFNRKQPKKLKNWNLDVSDASMLATIDDILDKSHATDWAMFRFIDNNQQEMQENVKYLSIDTYGSGGAQNLALHLSNIVELKYCLLRFDYGFDIQKHQIILIIYSPSTARNGQKRNIIPILRHKSLIKKTLCATSVITISIHSYLNPSFILSELYQKNLVPEILLRVTKTKTIRNRNEDEDDFKTHHHNHNDDDDNTVKLNNIHKFFASKQWTLARLQLELSKKYMNDTEIQITHILYNVTKRSKTFNSRRETEHIFNNAQDLDKTLSQLKLCHGSRIYISDISQQNDKNTHNKTLTNIFLAAQRRAQFTKTKTMSKTKKIKIKLKLSSHIRKIKSLKSMRKREKCDENLSKNVSLRIAQYEENETKRNLQNVKTRVKAKSFSSPRKKLLQPQTERKFEEQEEELTMSVSSRLLHYRQTSISDTEINELEVENVNTHFVTTHSEPTLTHSQRTRSLSQNMMKNVFVDKHFLEEYTNLLPQIFEPVVVQSKGKKKPLPLPLPPVIKQEEEEEERTEIECTLDLNQVFIVERSVGRGKTAHVHYAIYRDECDIALKEFRFGRLTEKILIDFHAELETLKKLDHENICRLLGHFVDENSKQLYLAFEWCPCGCLYEVIHDKSVGIQFIDVLEMSLDIAKGMQYLHSQNIIHRDLKSHNLLLDEAYRVKITDFGTAKTLEKIGGTTYTEVGTGGYCAPEVIEPPLQGYDSKIDVFSFGVLMWEIYTRKNIFDQRCLRNINQLRNGIRPKLDDCPVKYAQLIQQCWQFNPLFRPNFDQIVTILLQLYAEQQQSIK